MLHARLWFAQRIHSVVLSLWSGRVGNRIIMRVVSRRKSAARDRSCPVVKGVSNTVTFLVSSATDNLVP